MMEKHIKLYEFMVKLSTGMQAAYTQAPTGAERHFILSAVNHLDECMAEFRQVLDSTWVYDHTPREL